jgi:hypothetical protein
VGSGGIAASGRLAHIGADSMLSFAISCRSQSMLAGCLKDEEKISILSEIFLRPVETEKEAHMLGATRIQKEKA